MIKNIVDQERVKIEKIYIGSDHRLVRDKWLNIKRVLDALYKLISPIGKKEQTIKINPNEFQTEVFESVLEDLLNNKITGVYEPDKNAAIVSSEGLRNYYSGLIVIKDKELFEEYRAKISDLYNFIEEDGKRRFPSFYESEGNDKTIEELIETLKIDENKEINQNKSEIIEKEKIKKNKFAVTRIIKNGPIKRGGENVGPIIGVDNLANIVGDIINGMKGDKGSIFGVFGKWGRGKTYLIKRIKEVNVIKENFNCVYFHAWKYQDTPASWAYLYEELSKAYYDNSNWFVEKYKCIRLNIKKFGFWSPFIVIISIILSLFWSYISLDKKISWLFFILGFFGIIGFITIIKFVILFYKYKKTVVQLFKKYTQHKDLVKYLGLQYEIQQEIKSLLNVWVPENKKKILLVIDDIDRCSEDKIIQIVDALRVMLEDEEISKKIVVLIAVDENILKRAIKYKYSRLYENDKIETVNLTREYMDKLFLCGIRLGNLTNSEKELILENYIKRAEANENNASGNAVYDKDGLNIKQERELPLVDKNIQDEYNKYPSINNNEIDHNEEKSLKAAIKKVDNITPRQIDIFQFRYLLARDILWSMRGAGYDPGELCNLIAKYMVDFSAYETEVIDKKDEKDIIYKVLEMVITY